VRERRALQDDLRHAIAEGEFTLDYQPQFGADDKVIGFEALARWHSPKRGSVSPAIFIEAAEESNLILPLGEWHFGKPVAKRRPGRIPSRYL